MTARWQLDITVRPAISKIVICIDYRVLERMMTDEIAAEMKKGLSIQE